MLIRVGEFLKKDGQSRKMKFLKISDMTQDQLDKIGLTQDKQTKKKQLAEGSEMVYDVEARDFRIFNWKTTTSDVIQEEMEIEL